MVLTVLAILFFITIGIGVPIAWALGISSLGALICMGRPLSMIPQKIFSGMEIYTLLCIPFFILAGEFMGHGGLTKRLLNFGVMVLGSVRGGLALANVLASMLFGGITGSAIADASALGSVEIPMMVKNGYSKAFSAAVTGASACIGPIIPPSIPVIIYAMVVKGVSVGALFAAGIVPGILVGFSLMLTCYIISVKRKYPVREHKISLRDLLNATKDVFLAIMTPVIILGGIIGGIFTPTEAASVAAVYSFIIGFFVYKELRLVDLPGIFLKTGIVTGVVMIIIGTSNIFGLIVAFEQLALKVQAIMEPMGLYVFIFSVNILFLILGAIMDFGPSMLIMCPILAPIAISLGIDPTHFGILVIVNVVIGLITPPLGQVLFVVSPIAGTSFESVTREVIPFIIVMIAILLLISYVPFLSLYIPGLLGF